MLDACHERRQSPASMGIFVAVDVLLLHCAKVSDCRQQKLGVGTWSLSMQTAAHKEVEQ